ACSTVVNGGRVANACQYLRAAFAPLSVGTPAAANPKGSRKMVIARHVTRGMSSASSSSARRRVGRSALTSESLFVGELVIIATGAGTILRTPAVSSGDPAQ